MSSPPAVLDPPAAAAPPPPAADPPAVEAVAPPPPPPAAEVKEDVPPAAVAEPEPAAPPPPPAPPAPVAEEKPAEPEPVKAEEPAAPAVEPPTDAAVQARLRALLETANLAETSEKQVRKQLEDEFGVPLKDRKSLISGEIQAFLDARTADAAGGEAEEAEAAEADEGEDEPAPPPAKKAKKGKKTKAPGGMEPLLSPELAAFVGAPRMHRFKIVKAIWAYIKAHDLQDPNDKRQIVPDAKLGTILTAPVNMFSMNKQLGAHFVRED